MEVIRNAYSTKEFMEMTGLSRNTVYRALKKGELKHVRVGSKRILIPDWAIEDFLKKPST